MTHQETAIISVKVRPGDEDIVEERLRRIASAQASCEDCSIEDKAKRPCQLADVKALGVSAGRWDFVVIAATDSSRDAHGLVLHCIRKHLKTHVLDTETTLMYNKNLGLK